MGRPSSSVDHWISRSNRRRKASRMIWRRALIHSGMMAITAICSIFSAGILSLSDPLSPPLLGISPRDEDYFAGESIPCKDGSKFFRRDRLNDGFCDCPDGTDEPGTSACPEGRFYCRNVNGKPIFLFSSRVNDHICDCCDGSDEYDGRIACPDTCSKDAYFVKQSASHDLDVHRKIVNLDDLILRPKELKLAVMVEFFVAIGGITFCFIRFRNKSKTRRHKPRS